jgi:aspartate carbamoyltransferase catalytic subunit
MIRGMELTDEVADGLQSVVTEQVANGVKVRMAVLSRLLGGRDE